jgi:hypothetical protein
MLHTVQAIFIALSHTRSFLVVGANETTVFTRYPSREILQVHERLSIQLIPEIFILCFPTG